MKGGVQQKKKPYVREIPTSTSRVMYVRLDPSVFLHLFLSCDGAALSFTALRSEARKPEERPRPIFVTRVSCICLGVTSLMYLFRIIFLFFSLLGQRQN
jgi:hypothetical protein